MRSEDLSNWESCETKVFWGEIAPNDSVNPNEEDDEAFLDLLEGYITGGFKAGDCVVVLVTEIHRAKLYERLNFHRVRLNEMLVNRQFIAIDVEDTLEKFMINGHPDEERFSEAVNKVIVKANQSGRPIRVFGEMLAHLWAMGYSDATFELDQLWTKFCEKEALTIMHAYPGNALIPNATRPMMYMYGTHRKMVAPAERTPSEIIYIERILKQAV
jgi:hypothetical protein